MMPDEATRALAFAAAVKNLHATLLAAEPEPNPPLILEVMSRLAVLCVDSIAGEVSDVLFATVPASVILDVLGLDWHQARAIAQAAKDDNDG